MNSLELQQFTVVVPVGDGAGVVDADDEQAGSDGVSAWLAIIQRNVGRPFCTVVIVVVVIMVVVFFLCVEIFIRFK